MICKSLPYIVTISILSIFNIFLYFGLVASKNERIEMMLNGYLNSVSSLLIHDLNTANNNLIYNKKFFLFKNFSIISSPDNRKLLQNKLLSKIEIKPYAIHVKNPEEDIIFDLQELRENLIKIFPNYIDYIIRINSDNLISSNNYKQVTSDVKRDYTLTDNIKLSIELEIKNTSYFYLSEKSALYNKLLFSGIISSLGGLIFLFIYLKFKSKIETNLSFLELKLDEERKMKNALINNQKISQLLKNLFIKKSTEMYIKQELGDIPNEGWAIESISPNDYLFPMSLYDPSPEIIDLKLLKKYLEEYFSTYYITVAFKIKTVSTININCTVEVFYQVIFSLVFNLVELMDQQSDSPKAIELDFSSNDLIISYDSFPLDEIKMVDLSEKLLVNNKDIFLLSCRKIFKSLKEHQFKYKVYSCNEKNLVEIIYPLVIDNLSEQKKILDFSKYVRQRT